jgi:hypothetical protein
MRALRLCLGDSAQVPSAPIQARAERNKTGVPDRSYEPRRNKS